MVREKKHLLHSEPTEIDKADWTKILTPENITGLYVIVKPLPIIKGSQNIAVAGAHICYRYM